MTYLMLIWHFFTEILLSVIQKTMANERMVKSKKKFFSENP
jgi:hypothetical protein